MNHPDFLRDVYRESGEQIRNINQIRSTYRNFFIVGVAAFIALLAQNTDDDIKKELW